jgi:hypothetical protein
MEQRAAGRPNVWCPTSKVFDYSCAFSEIDGLIGNSSAVGNQRSKESRHDECDCGGRGATNPDEFARHGKTRI